MDLRFLGFRSGTINTMGSRPVTPSNAVARTEVRPGVTLKPITSGEDVLQRGWVMAWSDDGEPLTDSVARRVAALTESLERSWLDVVQF